MLRISYLCGSWNKNMKYFHTFSNNNVGSYSSQCWNRFSVISTNGPCNLNFNMFTQGHENTEFIILLWNNSVKKRRNWWQRDEGSLFTALIKKVNYLEEYFSSYKSKTIHSWLKVWITTLCTLLHNSWFNSLSHTVGGKIHIRVELYNSKFYLLK